MKTNNVLTLIGGISKASINKRLYAEILKHNIGVLNFNAFDIATLPFFSQDLEYHAPTEVANMKEMARSADAILIITPEYNRSIPGVLKNALDWGSRPYNDNCWNNKPAAVMGASIGATGTFGAQQHLRNVCSFLNMHLMSQPEFYFNASENMTENSLTENAVKYVVQFLDNFEKWISLFIAGK